MADMTTYRDFICGLPGGRGVFVVFKGVPWIGSFRRGQLCGRSGVGPAVAGAGAKFTPPADLQLDGRDAVPCDAGAVRSILPEGSAVVLEGRLRAVPPGRSDRHAYRPG